MTLPHSIVRCKDIATFPICKKKTRKTTFEGKREIQEKTINIVRFSHYVRLFRRNNEIFLTKNGDHTQKTG